jgi:hypothetical protein
MDTSDNYGQNNRNLDIAGFSNAFFVIAMLVYGPSVHRASLQEFYLL